MGELAREGQKKESSLKRAYTDGKEKTGENCGDLLRAMSNKTCYVIRSTCPRQVILRPPVGRGLLHSRPDTCAPATRLRLLKNRCTVFGNESRDFGDKVEPFRSIVFLSEILNKREKKPFGIL
ncbi:hypothetical protein TNCT_249261 [Trichonephila clavata]|uniref:Uncharacterized protein n=1 Tax=Trichonephila clavata TaxID=2740835 RepID=A0A8X6HRT2_TRICU|nr:hypothetical protein TNCT_249261 [Trichonephila clavata]